jgi:hypothetical protein
MYVSFSSLLCSRLNGSHAVSCSIAHTSHPLSFVAGHASGTFIYRSPQEREYPLMKSDVQLTFCQSRRTPASPTNIAPSAAPVSFRTRLSTWWPIHATHSAPPIVDVPLAQGLSVCSDVFSHYYGVSYLNLQRKATAGAPKKDDDLVPDEYFDSSNPDSQQPTAAAPVDSGEHGRLCSCL